LWRRGPLSLKDQLEMIYDLVHEFIIFDKRDNAPCPTAFGIDERIDFIDLLYLPLPL